MDRVVHAALAALVPCGDGDGYAGPGAGAGMDDVPDAAIAEPVFSDYDALADRDHSFGELHVPELPGAGTGDFAARRPVCAALVAAVHEKKLPRHKRGQTTCRTGS